MKYFLLICSIFFSAVSFAHTNTSGISNPSSKMEKAMIVNQDQIMFLENEIFVSIDNNWQRAERLESTPNGIFAYFWQWTCPKCGFKNPLSEKNCQRCSWSAN